jgi:hypothetical protein
LGHAHKKTTMNVLLKGKMAIIVNGQSKIIEGPFIFNSEPGRKFAYAIEDCIFQNLFTPQTKQILMKLKKNLLTKAMLGKTSKLKTNTS